MIAKSWQSEKLIADLERVVRDSEELLKDLSPAAGEPAYAREQEVTTWILVVALLVLSFFAGYLFWAKVTYSWPFQF